MYKAVCAPSSPHNVIDTETVKSITIHICISRAIKLNTHFVYIYPSVSVADKQKHLYLVSR